MIKERNSRVILIAAPSSSGKTSFAHRLSIQMRVSGVKSRAISLDDYFIEREHTPRKADGSYDYESIKTSFAHRLSIQMRVSGVKSRAISLDDYFIEREHTPRKADGSYDYESIKAIDVEKFNEDMNLFYRKRTYSS